MQQSIDYSIVICTYNPDERLLTRCLQAVSNLNRQGLSTETILVDNNSVIPVKSLPYIQVFLQQVPNLQIITEVKQGVQHARIAAIEKATGNHIVYIDYDNEPESDYLQQLHILNTAYPQVAAWGPGHVTVDFIDGVPQHLEGYARNAFQERHGQAVQYASKQEWQPCYPFGTGLCTKANILKEYNRLAAQDRFTLSGRSGTKLSSGEDTQMVLLCISMGYAAGVAPALKLRHIIPGSRVNMAYLRRLAYGTAVCYETCLCQVFPQRRQVLQQKLITPSKFSRQAIKKFIRMRFSTNPFAVFSFIGFLAMHAGIYTALGKPLPWPVKKLVGYLKLQ
ncbi:glycosyltransferase [Foetidibacter luteolus]|uniref:glycosyltransferase n=1 Tax=Foetidibacter luteolus TaxID=2608880 RepID=UPI00129AE973|nr:glycosyltransferase [Foetidibacter luteolus]